MYILQLMDNYCASFSALIIGFVEISVIAWLVNLNRCTQSMPDTPYLIRF